MFMKKEACFEKNNRLIVKKIWINIFLPLYGFTSIASTRQETLSWLKMSQRGPNGTLNFLWEVVSDGLCISCSLCLVTGQGQPTTTAEMHFSILLTGKNFS